MTTYSQLKNEAVRQHFELSNFEPSNYEPSYFEPSNFLHPKILTIGFSIKGLFSKGWVFRRTVILIPPLDYSVFLGKQLIRQINDNVFDIKQKNSF